MEKAILGLVAIAAIVGSRPPAICMGRKLREHCEQMAAQCKQMAGEFGARGEAVGRT